MKFTQARHSFKLGLAASAAALALIAGTAVAKEPIKIGAFLSVTGGAAFLGDPEQKTLELYVDKINAEGGVLGRKLKLVSYDSAGSAEKARTFAKRLIEEDKVDVIIGGSTTGETMAVIPLVEAAQIPFISGNGGFDKSMRTQCLDVAKKYGISVIADETYGDGDTDMTAQLTKIKNTAGVQAVLNAGFGAGPAIVTKNYRQVGITLPFYQSFGVGSKEYIRLSGGAAEGVRLAAGALLVADSLPKSDPQRAVLLSYKKAYESKYKSDVATFGGHAWDGLMLYVNAVKKAGTTDKAKVRDAIEATHGLVG